MEQFKTKYAQWIMLALFLACAGMVKAQTVSIMANPGTSGNGIWGFSNYYASESIYTQAEINTAFTFNKVRYNLTTLSSGSNTYGIEIYMRLTNSSVMTAGTYNLLGYTLVYAGTITHTATGFTEVTLTTPFTFPNTPGQNLQVLLIRNDNVVHTGNVGSTANGNNTSATLTSCRRYNGTALPTAGTTTLSATAFRPAIQLVNQVNIDANVTNIYTLGKMPIEYGAPTIIQARVANDGATTLTNVNVNLNISGTNTFSDIQTIPSLAPGASSIVNFASYSPANISTGDVVTVSTSVPGDGISSNDSKTWNMDVTPNVYTYKNQAVANSGGIGFNGGAGDFVAKFNSNIGQNYPYNLSNPAINEIKVDFIATAGNANIGQSYKVGIWDATGPGGTPGTLLWESPSTTLAAAGTSFISVPDISVAGDYFVGVRQTGTVLIGFAYQAEVPIRPQTFYYKSSAATSWTDFSPGIDFRFSIEVNVHIPVPPNCLNTAASYTPADGQILTCNTPILSWIANGGAPTAYSVYLSTNQADVAAMAPAALVSASQPGTTFNPGTLLPNTTYYWMVIPENVDGPASGCNLVSFTTGNLSLCYCVPTFVGTICAGSISDVTLNTLTNPSSCSAPAYTLYPATGSTTTTLEQNTTYNLSVTTVSSDIISVWIDYDQNGVFDASEWTQVATASTANVPATVALTIPGTATLGTTLMRVKSRFATNPNAATDACTQFGSGECEDYLITIAPQSPCTTPNPGNTIASVSSVCANGSVFLSMQNIVNGTGVTYQWESASDINFTQNVTSLGTGTTESVSVGTPTYYRCNVTCSNGPVTVASTPVLISVLPPTQCYCIPSYTSGTVGGDFCASVEIPGTTLNNPSGASATPFYTLFPQSGSTTCTLNAGSTYTLNCTAGTYTQNDFAAWIDYNANGILDDVSPYNEKIGEVFNIGASAVASFVFTVPCDVTPGTFRLRIREADQAGTIDPCTGLTWGETEDYNITIDPPANSSLNTTFIIQGYFDVNTNTMQPVLLNSNGVGSLLEADNVTVELHDATSPYALAQTFTGVQATNGQIVCTFPSSVIGTSYYVVLKGRNAIETWSANPVLMDCNTLYNFTSAAAQAYNGNQFDVSGTGVFAIYNGDVNQDGVVDGLDFNDWETDNNAFASGYFTTDFSGDGIVDGLDFLIWEPNNNAFVGKITP